MGEIEDLIGKLRDHPDLNQIIDSRISEALKAYEEKKFYDGFEVISVVKECPIAVNIAKIFGKELIDYDQVEFMDREKKCVINKNLNDKNIYVIATIHDADPDVSLANTKRLVSTLSGTCKVNKVIVVAPYLWYQTQEKTHSRREPISVREEVLDLQRRGMDHAIVCEMHAEQIEMCFNSMDHLKISPLVADYLIESCPDFKYVLGCADGDMKKIEDLKKSLGKERIEGFMYAHQVRDRTELYAIMNKAEN